MNVTDGFRKCYIAPYGNALVATRPFAPGEVVLRDRPLLATTESSTLLDEIYAAHSELGIRADLLGKDASIDFSLQMLQYYAASVEVRQAVMALFIPDPHEFQDEPYVRAARQYVNQLDTARSTHAEFVSRSVLRPISACYDPEEIVRVVLAWVCNCYSTRDGGGALFRVGSLVNHCCEGNTRYRFLDDDEGGSGVFVAIRPILPGEVITTCYLGWDEQTLLSTRMRQKLLAKTKLFTCTCSRCSRRLDPYRSLPCPCCNTDAGVSPGPRGVENTGREAAIHVMGSAATAATAVRHDCSQLPGASLHSDHNRGSAASADDVGGREGGEETAGQGNGDPRLSAPSGSSASAAAAAGTDPGRTGPGAGHGPLKTRPDDGMRGGFVYWTGANGDAFAGLRIPATGSSDGAAGSDGGGGGCGGSGKLDGESADPSGACDHPRSCSSQSSPLSYWECDTCGRGFRAGEMSAELRRRAAAAGLVLQGDAADPELSLEEEVQGVGEQLDWFDLAVSLGAVRQLGALCQAVLGERHWTTNRCRYMVLELCTAALTRTCAASRTAVSAYSGAGGRPMESSIGGGSTCSVGPGAGPPGGAGGGGSSGHPWRVGSSGGGLVHFVPSTLGPNAAASSPNAGPGGRAARSSRGQDAEHPQLHPQQAAPVSPPLQQPGSATSHARAPRLATSAGDEDDEGPPGGRGGGRPAGPVGGGCSGLSSSHEPSEPDPTTCADKLAAMSGCEQPTGGSGGGAPPRSHATPCSSQDSKGVMAGSPPQRMATAAAPCAHGSPPGPQRQWQMEEEDEQVEGEGEVEGQSVQNGVTELREPSRGASLAPGAPALGSASVAAACGSAPIPLSGDVFAQQHPQQPLELSSQHPEEGRPLQQLQQPQQQQQPPAVGAAPDGPGLMGGQPGPPWFPGEPVRAERPRMAEALQGHDVTAHAAAAAAAEAREVAPHGGSDTAAAAQPGKVDGVAEAAWTLTTTPTATASLILTSAGLGPDSAPHVNTRLCRAALLQHTLHHQTLQQNAQQRTWQQQQQQQQQLLPQPGTTQAATLVSGTPGSGFGSAAVGSGNEVGGDQGQPPGGSAGKADQRPPGGLRPSSSPEEGEDLLPSKPAPAPEPATTAAPKPAPEEHTPDEPSSGRLLSPPTVRPPTQVGRGGQAGSSSEAGKPPLPVPLPLPLPTPGIPSGQRERPVPAPGPVPVLGGPAVEEASPGLRPLEREAAAVEGVTAVVSEAGAVRSAGGSTLWALVEVDGLVACMCEELQALWQWQQHHTPDEPAVVLKAMAGPAATALMDVVKDELCSGGPLSSRALSVAEATASHLAAVYEAAPFYDVSGEAYAEAVTVLELCPLIRQVLDM